MKKIILLHLLMIYAALAAAEDGYELWMRYRLLDKKSIQAYKQQISSVWIVGQSPTMTIIRNELSQSLPVMLNDKIPFNKKATAGTLIIGNLASLQKMNIPVRSTGLTEDGFLIKTLTIAGQRSIVISGTTDVATLYGCFHFLRILLSGQIIQNFSIISSPKSKLRMLNHWDNLDRHVERGYAGISIFNWHTLPNYIDPRYVDYARANASLGINGVALTNVNANALVLSHTYLEKVKALADIFRAYGIKVYLTARFSAPIELSKLSTADPLNDSVQQWWQQKVKEIYQLIPDFGGFLVKANSEGQPGPQNYNRSHADGANMLAKALAPNKGIVIWRAFVYNPQSDDRFKQAYDEFKPLDGKFEKNVLVQVKNGPIDFQPREPFSPLFGAMTSTPVMMEFQLTQEYLGQGTHLVYQAPLYKEVLDADTYVKGEGSTVSKVVDGSLLSHSLNGMAAVSNIGNDRNWTGHLFGQANWYAFGRLAWDHQLSAEAIADEWIAQTFSNATNVASTIKKIMLSSHETLVNYMTPLGLHHIMGNGHHYGPAPWSDDLPRPDWNPVYFHRADSKGIGFNRTATGTNALAQYAPEVRARYEKLESCDEKYLLWFHHVDWNHVMKSGKTLWEELCYKYDDGVKSIKATREQWHGLKNFIDQERFRHVSMMLDIQVAEATWWRDACLLYFQAFSQKPIPASIEKTAHSLEYYRQLQFPYAPGN